jgi:CubicO group peptidase (beta-lactamase class C family)
MKLIALNLFLIMAPAKCILAQVTEPEVLNFSQKVDSVFADWNRPDVPGGSLAVIFNGEVIIKKGFGLANLRQNTSNTPATEFNIASVAKQFTAMCIVLLEEQGKLSLDDDIHKYFPEFQFKEKITGEKAFWSFRANQDKFKKEMGCLTIFVELG